MSRIDSRFLPILFSFMTAASMMYPWVKYFLLLTILSTKTSICLYKCLIVSLVFSHLGFWSGNLFLIAPFPDLCLLVPFSRIF